MCKQLKCFMSLVTILYGFRLLKKDILRVIWSRLIPLPSFSERKSKKNCQKQNQVMAFLFGNRLPFLMFSILIYLL